MSVKKGRDSLSGETIMSEVCVSSQTKYSLKVNKNDFLRSKFFPGKVDPFFKRAIHAGKLTGSHKWCLPWRKWRNIYHVYLFFLTCCNRIIDMIRIKQF